MDELEGELSGMEEIGMEEPVKVWTLDEVEAREVYGVGIVGFRKRAVDRRAW